MANTDRISGKDVYVSFAGTEISGDFTSVSFSEEEDLIDVTAGDDTYHYYLPLNRKDGECSIESFWAGTATFQALAVGSAGTLLIGPRGTATGATPSNPKYTWDRVVVKTREVEHPFDNSVTYSVTFQFSSALAESAY